MLADLIADLISGLMAAHAGTLLAERTEDSTVATKVDFAVAAAAAVVVDDDDVDLMGDVCSDG